MPVWSLLCLLVRAGSPAAEANPALALPLAVERAVTDALTPEGARAIVRGYQVSSPCPATEANLGKPIDGSGRYPVRLSGPACQGWAWVTVEVRAPAAVTTRKVAKGELLEGAIRLEEREVRRARAPALVPAGARAARPLSRGQIIEAAHLLTPGVVSGGTVKVVVRVGTLSVTQTGRLVPCSGGSRCAVLPSGKHVTGEIVDGQLVVEGP